MYEEVLNLTTNFIVLFRRIIKKHNITLPQGLILLSIGYNRQSMSSLVQRLALDPSTMTRNIEKLEKRQLVYRQKSEKDSRVMFVYKTEKATVLINEIESEIKKKINFSFSDKVKVKDNINKVVWLLEKINNQ